MVIYFYLKNAVQKNYTDSGCDGDDVMLYQKEYVGIAQLS